MELSLNAPARCITSIKGDTKQHRFLIGTCAHFPPSSSNDDSDNNPNTDNSNSINLNNTSLYTPETTLLGGSKTDTNMLHLLRYHEEMNELAIDAQLEIPMYELNDGVMPEVWCCSSCPNDRTLIVTSMGNSTLGVANGGGGDGEVEVENGASGQSQTSLWRIPSEALREDELEYYPDGGMMEDEYLSGGTMSNFGAEDEERNLNNAASSSSQQDMGDGNLTLEKVADLPFLGDGDGNRTGRSIYGTMMKGRVSDIQWNPEMNMDGLSSSSSVSSGTNATSSGANLLTIDYNGSCITAWDINSASAIPINTISIPEGGGAKIQRQTIGQSTPAKLSWDPHNSNICAATCGSSIVNIDFRCSSYTVVNGIKSCHKFGVTDLDYNPNKANMLSTCGQDGLVKFWDLRYTSSSSDNDGESETKNPWNRQNPVKILRGGNSHWTTVIKYNSFHDQLLLSGGTDGVSNLWRISSISSAPLLDLATGGFTMSYDDDDDISGSGSMVEGVTSFDSIGIPKSPLKKRNNQENVDPFQSNNDTTGKKEKETQDIRIATMEMSEAVYDVAWSAADAWVYTTLGYDGSVVLNHVPSNEKYKILL